MTEPWRIYLLGGLRAEQGAVVVERFRSQKFGGLLAYLALFPERSHPREELADRFWPDSDVEAARASLRQALASLRRQMEPPPLPMGSVLETDRLYIRLNPDAVRVDVAAFEAAARAGARDGADAAAARAALEEATALYRGDLLPGFYDDWVLTERERLRFAYFEVLGRLADLHAREGRPAEAAEAARRLVAAEPAREESHRLLMRHLIAAGRPGDALRQYEELSRTLRDRWDGTPEPETDVLAQEARNTLASPEPPSPPVAGEPLSTQAAVPAPLPPPPAVSPEPETAAVQLPLRFNRFFGRTAEIARVHELLISDEEGAPVITLTGPPGAGKTRLAVEAAEALVNLFPGGVWFVSLADASDPARVDDALADALGAARSPTTPARQAAVGVLKRRAAQGRALLLLDNAEHLVEAVADVTLALLAAVPSLSLLVTSRVRLELEGEREVALLPLPVPELPGTPERLLEFPAVALFADRARRALPDFALTPRNAAAVAALCQKLEGVPLALELAAARAAVMTPAQMLEQVNERFDFLVSRRRDLPERHRSLRAAVAWSVDLLSAPSRQFLARLSVFRGGCTLEAAREVCGNGDVEETIERLADLRGASLVLVEPGGDPDAMRYRMLEAVREYADSLLTPEERAELQRRHLLACFTFLQSQAGLSRTAEAAGWMRRMNAELPNLRAAIEWALTGQTNPLLPQRLIRGMTSFFQARNLFSEVRSYLTRALAMPGASTAASPPGLPEEDPRITRARTLKDAGGFATVQCDYAAAGPLLKEALALSEAVGDLRGVISAQNALGLLAEMQDDHVTAQRYYRESEALHERYPIRPATAAWLRHHLGGCADALGDPETAARLYGEALEMRRALGDRRGTALVLSHIGRLEAQEGAPRKAVPYYREALNLWAERDERYELIDVLAWIAELALEPEYEDAPAAARLIGAVNAIHAATDTTVSPKGEEERLERLARLEERLGEAESRRLRAEGETLPFRRVLTLAYEILQAYEPDSGTGEAVPTISTRARVSA